MWVEWLSDELNLGDNRVDEQIVALFETALSDYHYRKVYKLYLKYLLGCKQRHAGTSQAKADHSPVFERALRIWGLDIEKGNSMWQLYADLVSSEPHKLASVTRRRCAQAIEGSSDIFKKYIASETDSDKATRTRAKHEASLATLVKLKEFDAEFESCLD